MIYCDYCDHSVVLCLLLCLPAAFDLLFVCSRSVAHTPPLASTLPSVLPLSVSVTIPVTQQAVVPALSAQKQIDFGRCFLKQAYAATLTMENQSDILQRV